MEGVWLTETFCVGDLKAGRCGMVPWQRAEELQWHICLSGYDEDIPWMMVAVPILVITRESRKKSLAPFGALRLTFNR